MVRLFWEWLIFLAALLLLALWIGMSNLVLALITPLPRRSAWARRVISLAARSYFGLISRMGVITLDARELRSLRREQGLILVSNHPSLMDAMLFVGPLTEVTCVMKASLHSSPLWMIGARIAGYISTRNSHQLIDEACEQLVLGEKLLIFPEGTRTRTPPVNDFKGGFGLIAKKSQAPVQTIILETNSPFLQKGWPIWKKPPLPLRYSFRLGKVFSPTPDMKVKKFVSEVETYYRETLKSTSETAPPKPSS